MKKNKVGKEARKPLNTWQNMRMFTMSLLIMQPKMENSFFFAPQTGHGQINVVIFI